MRHVSWMQTAGVMIPALTVIVVYGHGAIASPDPVPSQALVLAALVSGILSCDAGPCLGTMVSDLYDSLEGRIVSDGVDCYSDLAGAYPAASTGLRGIVRWDLDEVVEGIALTIVEFGPTPAGTLSAIENAIPGCDMEGDGPEADPEADSAVERDGIPEYEWSCSAGGEDGEVDIYLYFGRDIIIVEIGA